MKLSDKIKENYKKRRKLSKVAKLPNNIMIEVTNSCNLRCTMCANKYMKRKRGFMDEELFKRIVDECVELGIENMGLYSTGEAFLHPKIFDFIKYAKERGIKYVYITSNGMLLDKDKAKKVIESKLDSIKFSIDAGSKEEYEKVRIGGNWEKLVRNITDLNEERRKSGSSLKMFGSYLIRKGKEGDLENYKKTFEGILDESVYAYLNNQGGQVDIDVGNKLIDHPCSHLWNRMVVNYDGTITACCIDFEGQLNYGDLRNNTLKGIWNNKVMKEFREMHLEGRQREMPMCRDCVSEEGNWGVQ